MLRQKTYSEIEYDRKTHLYEGNIRVHYFLFAYNYKKMYDMHTKKLTCMHIYTLLPTTQIYIYIHIHESNANRRRRKW